MVLDWRFFLVYIVLYHFYEMIVYDRYTIESLLVQAFVVFMVFPRSKYLIQKNLQFMHLFFEFLLYGQVVSTHWTRTLKWGGGGDRKAFICGTFAINLRILTISTNSKSSYILWHQRRTKVLGPEGQLCKVDKIRICGFFYITETGNNSCKA